jgi:hypothetical protein
MKRRILLGALLLATVAMGIGCTTTVINPGTDSSATYRLGQLTAQEDKDIGAVYAASEAAVDELGLSIIQKYNDELEANIVARDAQDKKIVIELVSLTKSTTEVKVKVGSPDKAGRIYQTIHEKL